jgi:hypothetical protein
MLYATDGQVTCIDTPAAEALTMARRAPNLVLQAITPQTREEEQTGLRIILRGTPQLDQFPQATDALMQAASVWESLIATPITLVIDVDFGPTRFGVPYPNPNTLGSTLGQMIGGDVYPQVRDQLMAGASSEDERILYQSLPVEAVPTDLGDTVRMFAPSGTFRALGLIAPVADPDPEQAPFGDPPSIGFNSAFNWDFNPDDGIDVDKVDFVGVTIHEMGHALGLSSLVERQSSAPNAPAVLTIWDLFRFRPGEGFDFSTAQRLLSSGNDQVFFADGPELSLSTGRSGDGNQASHWKADELSGFYIGVMDPTLASGEQAGLTDSDLMALDAMGYTLQNAATPPAPQVAIR